MKTALYSQHQAAHAKFIDFFGWEMPFSYSTVVKEHQNVRTHVGLFDVSHMGEVFVSGPSAESFLNHLTVNNVASLQDGQGQYTAICKPSGGMIDDLILYRLKKDQYLLCINASRVEADTQWIFSQGRGIDHLKIENASPDWSQIAIQGPETHAVLKAASSVIEGFSQPLEYNHIRSMKILGHDAFLARTGYTGEVGYEIYIKNEGAPALWETLLKFGSPFSISPIGLGARDTLRLESCYLLYGNDMNEQISPLEADIAWTVKLSKGEFIGKEAIENQKKEGLKQKLVAFKMIDSAIPRHDMTVLNQQQQKIGYVTSGCSFPSLGGSGGLAMIQTSHSLTEPLWIDVRGASKQASIVKKPFYASHTKDH